MLLQRPPPGKRKPWGKKDVNAVVDNLRGARLNTTTPGLKLQHSYTGTSIDYTDPGRMRWVFITAILEWGLQCQEAIWTEYGWRAGSALIHAKPAPNYTPAHFAYFLISGNQPLPTDLACRLYGNYVVPDYRFKLVEPPDPASCAECT